MGKKMMKVSKNKGASGKTGDQEVMDGKGLKKYAKKNRMKMNVVK